MSRRESIVRKHSFCDGRPLKADMHSLIRALRRSIDLTKTASTTEDLHFLFANGKWARVSACLTNFNMKNSSLWLSDREHGCCSLDCIGIPTITLIHFIKLNCLFLTRERCLIVWK